MPNFRCYIYSRVGCTSVSICVLHVPAKPGRLQILQELATRNLSQCSWDTRQHQYNFVCRLSWSISSNFSKNLLSKCAPQPKIAKNSLKPLFLGSRSFKVIDVGTHGKLVSSACYDAQQVCVYLQPMFVQCRTFHCYFLLSYFSVMHVCMRSYKLLIARAQRARCVLSLSRHSNSYSS